MNLTQTVAELMPGLRADLERLVRIPSISADGFDPEAVRSSAQATTEILERAGFGGVRTLEIEGAHPAVLGEIPAPDGAPTVLLYAHHDVQPPGPSADWDTPAFEPVERNGRLYGRGTSDDKCGIIVHAGAVAAHHGRPAVGVKVFVEGEEEIGSRHLAAFLSRHGEQLAADAIVIADSANWRVGHPAFTTSLRGLVDCVVEVRTAASGVHSGLFGGAVPDALTALIQLLATLHDPEGRVAVPGLAGADSPPLDLTEEELRATAGLLPGVSLIGEGSLTSRIWSRPAISILAVDAPPVREAINQLLPVARAKVSLRTAPGDDATAAMAALRRHLEEHAPWGVELKVQPGASAAAFTLDTSAPAYDAFRRGMRAAWEREPTEIGVGGSIPFVSAFAEAYPEAAILLTGAADSTSQAHGPNESVDLEELRRAVMAEAIALDHLAP